MISRDQVKWEREDKNILFIQTQVFSVDISHLPVDGHRCTDQSHGNSELQDHQSIQKAFATPPDGGRSQDPHRGKGGEDKGRVES